MYIKGLLLKISDIGKHIIDACAPNKINKPHNNKILRITSNINPITNSYRELYNYITFNLPNISGTFSKESHQPTAKIISKPQKILLPKPEILESNNDNSNIEKIEQTENFRYCPPPNAREVGDENFKDKMLDLAHTKIASTIKKNKASKIKTLPVKSQIIKPNKAPSLNLPSVSMPSINLPSLNIKNKISNKINTIKSDIGYCYNLTKHLTSFYGLRHESLLGIDITPNCIYLCKIDGLNGKRVLTSLTSVCMEGKFMAEDISNYQDEYAASLKELVKENNIETKNVALSIPVSNSIVRTVTIPTMDDNEIKKALKFGSLWNNFMHPDQNPEDYSIFYQIICRNKHSETMDILFVATKLSDISLYTNIVEKSGLNPVIVDVRCFAISNALNHKVNSTNIAGGPSVFYEFGFEDNYIMIVDGDKAQVFEINITDAHRVAITDKAMDEEAIQEFVEHYIKKAKQAIYQYEETNERYDIKNIFVLSTVPLAKSITEKMSKLMDGYNISECNFFDCMRVNDDFTVSKDCAKQNISAWTAAISAAIRKIDIFGNSETNPKYNYNMLPAAGEYEFQKRTKYYLNTLSVVASAALVWFVTTTQADLNNRNKALSLQLAELNNVEQQYNGYVSEINSLESANNKVDKINNIITASSQSQQKLLSVYEYLNLVILDDIWLRELEFTSPNHLKITGGSLSDQSIIEFMSLLNEGNQFDNVSLRNMREIREVSVQHADVINVKTFKLDSKISNKPVYDFNEINQVAGDSNTGS